MFNEQDLCWHIHVYFGLWLDGFKLFWGADYSIVNRLKKVLQPFWLIVVLVAPLLLLYDDISWYDVVTDSLLLTSKMNGLMVVYADIRYLCYLLSATC